MPPEEHEEELEDPPDDEDEQESELEEEAEDSMKRATAELVREMKSLREAVSNNAKALEKLSFRSAALERSTKSVVRDGKESFKKQQPDQRKTAAEKKASEVLTENSKDEAGEKKSEWAAGKWMAVLTGVVMIGPSLLNMFEGLVRTIRGEGPGNSDLPSEVISKIEAYAVAHAQESDTNFWNGIAGKIKEQVDKGKKPTSADLILMFNFISLLNPLQKPLAWDSMSEYADLTDTVGAKMASDLVAGIKSLATLKTKAGAAVPRGSAAGIAQNAVSLGLLKKAA